MYPDIFGVWCLLRALLIGVKGSCKHKRAMWIIYPTSCCNCKKKGDSLSPLKTIKAIFYLEAVLSTPV